MKKWICLVCGWVYDEALGAPDEGIAPGTKWEDIPDDWTCPDCGVGKEDFEMVEVKSPASAPNQAAPEHRAAIDPVIIIGSGLAAHNLVKEFRKQDSTTPITMISREEGNLYYKPNLSCGLTTGKTPDDLIMSGKKALESELSFILKPFTSVTDIDPENKQIQAGSERLSYSKLVFATGANAIHPPFGGTATDLLHSVNDLLDYRTYRNDLIDSRKVVIIGAGLIGCEFANDLVNRGIAVEVIDAFDRCMPNLLPEEAARAVERSLGDKGATFHFNRKVTAVDKAASGYSLKLDNGDHLTADLVLSAVGLRARTALAEKAGLEIDKGISVNRYLETSQPDIYALGDCADVEGHNLMYVEPLLLSAKALARTLSGDRTAVAYRVMPVTVKTPACPVVVAVPPAGTAGEWDIHAAGNDVEALFRDETGEVVGFALTGAAVQNRKQWDTSLPPLLT